MEFKDNTYFYSKYHKELFYISTVRDNLVEYCFIVLDSTRRDKNILTTTTLDIIKKARHSIQLIPVNNLVKVWYNI